MFSHRYLAQLSFAFLIASALSGCDRSGDDQVANPPNLAGDNEPISAAELLAAGKDPLVGADSFGPASTDSISPNDKQGTSFDPLGQPRTSTTGQLSPIPGSPSTGSPSTGSPSTGSTVPGGQHSGSQIPGAQSGLVGTPQTGIGNPAMAQADAAQQPIDPAEIARQAIGTPMINTPIVDAPLKLSDAIPATTDQVTDPQQQAQPQYQLKADMTPKELTAFISNADKDMRTINSGRSAITDPREAHIQMGTISRLKLEASRALQDHPNASNQDIVEGTRGEMQALSHLAGMKNAAAANELMALATKNLKADDPGLVSDSRIVLIGFALESLQAGVNEKAPDQIVSLVRQFKKNEENTSVPAMMVMAQARNVLTQYGYDEQALAVREQIVELFSDSPDPTIASLAKQAAGSVVYDNIDKLLTETLDGENTSVAHWREAVNNLIDAAPDLATSRYLSGAALEFESLNNDPLADATYDVLAQRFKDPDHPATADVQAAIQFRKARQDVVGTYMKTSFRTITGAALPISNFKGKVVMMPFWAMQQPASLQILPLLRKIQQEHPDQVAIVGMNFDSDEAPLEEFMMKVKLDFPSYASAVSNTTPENSILAKFGLVSLPFVAILNQDGQVVALDFRGRNIDPTVKRLLKQ